MKQASQSSKPISDRHRDLIKAIGQTCARPGVTAEHLVSALGRVAVGDLYPHVSPALKSFPAVSRVRVPSGTADEMLVLAVMDEAGGWKVVAAAPGRGQCFLSAAAASEPDPDEIEEAAASGLVALRALLTARLVEL